MGQPDFTSALRELRGLIAQRKLAEAEAFIESAEPEDAYGEHLVARGQLCETVADRLAGSDDEGASWLYRAALERFRQFAGHATGAGDELARMIDVERVQRKLRI